MDFSQLNMNDPRMQQLVAEFMRQQKGGPNSLPQVPSAPAPGALAAPPMAPQAPAAPAPPVQPQLQNGPPVAAPQGAQLDPTLVDSVLGIQAQEGERNAARRGYALADAMRGDSQKYLQGRMLPSSTGGMYVGPGWAGALAGVAGSALASRRERDIDKQIAKLDADRMKAQRGYFDTLTGQMRKRDPRDDMGGWGSLSDY